MEAAPITITSDPSPGLLKAITSNIDDAKTKTKTVVSKQREITDSHVKALTSKLSEVNTDPNLGRFGKWREKRKISGQLGKWDKLQDKIAKMENALDQHSVQDVKKMEAQLERQMQETLTKKVISSPVLDQNLGDIATNLGHIDQHMQDISRALQDIAPPPSFRDKPPEKSVAKQIKTKSDALSGFIKKKLSAPQKMSFEKLAKSHEKFTLLVAERTPYIETAVKGPMAKQTQDLVNLGQAYKKHGAILERYAGSYEDEQSKILKQACKDLKQITDLIVPTKSEGKNQAQVASQLDLQWAKARGAINRIDEIARNDPDATEKVKAAVEALKAVMTYTSPPARKA